MFPPLWPKVTFPLPPERKWRPRAGRQRDRNGAECVGGGGLRTCTRLLIPARRGIGTGFGCLLPTRTRSSLSLVIVRTCCLHLWSDISSKCPSSLVLDFGNELVCSLSNIVFGSWYGSDLENHPTDCALVYGSELSLSKIGYTL